MCNYVLYLIVSFSYWHTAIDAFCLLAEEEDTPRRSFEIVVSLSMRASCNAFISSLRDAIRDSKLPEWLSLISSYEYNTNIRDNCMFKLSTKMHMITYYLICGLVGLPTYVVELRAQSNDHFVQSSHFLLLRLQERP